MEVEIKEEINNNYHIREGAYAYEKVLGMEVADKMLDIYPMFESFGRRV